MGSSNVREVVGGDGAAVAAGGRAGLPDCVVAPQPHVNADRWVNAVKLRLPPAAPVGVAVRTT